MVNVSAQRPTRPSIGVSDSSGLNTGSSAPHNQLLSSNPTSAAAPTGASTDRSVSPGTRLGAAEEQQAGRGARRGSAGKRRAGSLQDSQPNQRSQTAPKVGGSNTTAPTKASSTEKSNKRGVSRFFALLNCCSTSENSDVPQQPGVAEPSRKITKTRSDQGAPIAAATKQGSTQGISSGTNLEKTQEPASSTSPAAAPVATSEKTAITGIPSQDIQHEKPMPQLPVTHPQTARERNLEKPLPASPTLAVPVIGGAIGGGLLVGGVATATSHEKRGVEASPPEVVISPATPIVAQGDNVISDRTPMQQQIDTDIEMGDSAPSLPLVGGSEVSSTEFESPITQVDQHIVQGAFPPPPASQRQIQIVAPPSRSSIEESASATGSETQRWLLPPIRPEMRGKKCLVLDLDETLVHSSFKVSDHSSMFALVQPTHGVYRYCTRQISPFRWKLKASTTTCMSSKDLVWISS